MAVAELFIGAFITILFEKLASGDLIRLAQSTGIDSELNKWRHTLIQIQAVLVDAGQKHIEQKSVQLWLNKLQHLAYEIDDVLDDLATEALRSQLNQDSSTATASRTSKVLKFIPRKIHANKYDRKMRYKLDEITAKMSDLIEEKKLLGLIDNIERSHKPSRRSNETSVIGHESKIIGREGDKKALLGMLLGDESSSSQNMNVVSIVGQGGIGKTTVARLLYNDKKVKDHFELRSWVCVSDEFDVLTISKTIFRDFGGDDTRLLTLNQVQVALIEKLSTKRFLLVLDDVWNENDDEWELLQRPFTVGAPGSITLVTTQKTKVASTMDSVQVYPLNILSFEEALSLFSQHALGKHNFDVNQTLNLHGADIVKKCGSLPLALITLGRAFRTKSKDKEWEELLNSDIWNSNNESKILLALRVSYYDLPPHLKQMFAYCCLFPKDYTLDKDELTLLWMAEGFLNVSNGNNLMENFGQECFEELVSRSFFQQSIIDKSRYTMHDLIHDLATSVAGEFFLMMDDKMFVYNKIEALEKSRHLSFILGKYQSYRKFEALQRARGLRSLLAIPVRRQSLNVTSRLSDTILFNPLSHLHSLRALSLAHCSITEVPELIGSLKHLRYLNFSSTYIRCLPEQVGDLQNLQSLLLYGCHNLSSLPNSIIKLINLRHLGISHTPWLNKMPLGLGGLTRLQTLSKVIIGGVGEYKVSDLKGLLHLRGQLCIAGLHEVKDASHAKEANLYQKKGICELEMRWSDVFDDSRNEITEYEVLEGLRPFEKLRILNIMYYSGTKFPSWVGDPSYVCITQLTLSGCISCTCLPTLGHLRSLQTLFFESMPKLTRVGSELLGYSNSNSASGNAFPSLEILKFKDMQAWEEWSTSGGEESKAFPHLREISMINCPKLDMMAIELIPSLQRLHIEQCSVGVLRSMVSVSSSILRLNIGNIRGLTQLHGIVLEHLKAVEYLKISECGELTHLWESEAEACEILVRLQKLEVRECALLLSLEEKEENPVISMESVTKVRVEGCTVSKSNNFRNKIENGRPITSLTFPTASRLPSALQFLHITGCGNEEVSWLHKNFFSSLESLNISLQNLRLLPEGCLAHLTNLTIAWCDKIESIPDNGYGFLPFLCLRELTISGCKNLTSFPHEHLQSLTSLKTMEISKCPSLDDSFPCGLWPPNLSSLKIGELKKPIPKWGLQNFPTSLVTLELYGDEKSGVVPFAKAKEEDMMSAGSSSSSSSSSSFVLPSSLTYLFIHNFMELESLSEGLQHLTDLKHLAISNCWKLRDLPETLLPSLTGLTVFSSSPKLRKKCSRKGKYWPIISQIPSLMI